MIKPILLIVTIVLFVSCQERPNHSESTTPAKRNELFTDSATRIIDGAINTKENWTYEEEVDEMTSYKNRYAHCKSDDVIEFAFSHNGGSTFSLNVSNNHNGNAAYVEVSKGQFLTKSVLVKIDSSKAVKYRCYAYDDGRTNVVMIYDADRFIDKLKNAKKIIIEAQFYEEGFKNIHFNVAGLKWNKNEH